MTKKIFLFTFFLVLSSPTWSAQNLLRVGTEKLLHDGLHCVSRCFPVRFFSDTPHSNVQVYTIPTYDAAFKWVLSDNDIRPSFFHAFIPDLNIKSSERLDEHMNPIEKLQTLREFLHKEATSSAVKKLSGSGAYIVKSTSRGKKSTEKDDAATAFLHEMIGRFDEIKTSFPKQRYDGAMDFVCKLDGGDYALVEMQVIPENYWDRRALAYVAAFYGNQLSRGDKWKHIRKVIGLNILGGGKENKTHWSDTPGHFMRHYKFEDQLNGKSRYIDGIELIQYSIMQAPTVTDQEKQDWLTFFRKAHDMSENDVKDKIKTPAVLQAFERAKFSKLPAEVQAAYEAEDKEYDRYSQHTTQQIEEAVKKHSQHTAEQVLEGRMKTVLQAIKAGVVTQEQASSIFKLSSEESKVLKSIVDDQKKKV